MAAKKLFVLACVVAAVASFPSDSYSSPGGNQPGMPYNFEWTVNAPAFGNDYGHAEQSDGNAVQGMYYVLLPDGRRQTVTYTADGSSGYVANVQYEGEASFPEAAPAAGGGYN